MEQRVRRIGTAAALMTTWMLTMATPVVAGEQEFTQALAALATADSYADKEAAAAAIAASAHPRAETVLAALLKAELYTRGRDSRVVMATDAADGFALLDAATGEDLGTADKGDVGRLTVNNALRSSLRGMLATLKLRHPDPAQRIAAIRGVGESEDLEMRQTLTALLATEQNPSARTAIDTAVATLNLDSTEPLERLSAIEHVGRVVNSLVRTKLSTLAGNESMDGQTRTAARRALMEMERRVAIYDVVQTAFFGLSLGSILVLAAIGLSVTFGIMGVINMAHGELMMLCLLYTSPSPRD